jgi:hypothetical protein
MSEQKLRLPDFLLADLYKSSLVEIESTITNNPDIEESEDIKPLEAKPTGEIKYLGKNGKNVTIIVQQTEAEYLKKDDLAFLTNILKACQLTISDIGIVNISSQQVTFQQLKEQLGSKFVILFDVEPSAIKLPFIVPAFQVQSFDSSTVMMAPPLSTLNLPSQEGRTLKTKLWMSLKQMFGI